MCGIYGIVNPRLTEENGRTILDRMDNLLRHRGPDARGFHIKEGVNFGHRRLSIIDLKTGAQPIYNEDSQIALIYNGEIYNYMELKEALSLKGHVFKSSTDSEVIVHGYEEWGEDCVKHLRGMFAFAISDMKEKKIFLARDRLGIKPLYYLKTKGVSGTPGWVFAFSSEAKAFRAIEGLRFSLDHEMAALFLGFSFVPDSERTLIKEIFKLPPGHTLIFKDGEIIIKRYWALDDPDEESDMSFDKAVERFTSLLSESVDMELVSDVPLGVLLSGGLDSTAVTALASRRTKGLKTFTAGFAHPLDERHYGKIASRHYSTLHHEIIIDHKDAITRFEEIAWYLDDLSSADGGFFTTYLMAEKIKESGVKVILVGEGSDEILGGYSRFGISQLPFSAFPSYMRAAFYYYAMTKGIPRMKNLKHIGFLNDRLNHGKDIFRQASRFEVNLQLPNHLLMKVDKATMAHSIEARVPFLDHKVVEFIYRLPRRYKLKGSFFSKKNTNEKHIMRIAMKGLLPEEILKRKKRGFLLPIPYVLREGSDKVKAYLLDKDSVARHFLKTSEIENLLKSRRLGFIEEERENFLWRLFLMDVWSTLYL